MTGSYVSLAPWKTSASRAPTSPRQGRRVYTSDGEKVGKVEHVLAVPEDDIFDGIVLDTSVLPGGHRFVDADQVEEIFERGVLLKIDRQPAEKPAGAERRTRPPWRSLPDDLAEPRGGQAEAEAPPRLGPDLGEGLGARLGARPAAGDGRCAPSLTR